MGPPSDACSGMPINTRKVWAVLLCSNVCIGRAAARSWHACDGAVQFTQPRDVRGDAELLHGPLAAARNEFFAPRRSTRQLDQLPRQIICVARAEEGSITAFVRHF